MEGTTPQTPPDAGSGTAILPPPGQAPQTQPGGPTDIQPPGPGGPGGGGGGGGGGDGRDGGWDEPGSTDESRKVGWLVAALIALGVLAVVLIVILVASSGDDDAADTTTTRERPTTTEATTTTTTTAPPPMPTAQITAANTTVTCAPNAGAIGTQISWTTTDATSVVVTGPSPFNEQQTPFKQTAPNAAGVGVPPSQECTAAPFTDQYDIVAENSTGRATASATIQWLAP